MLTEATIELSLGLEGVVVLLFVLGTMRSVVTALGSLVSIALRSVVTAFGDLALLACSAWAMGAYVHIKQILGELHVRLGSRLGNMSVGITINQSQSSPTIDLSSIRAVSQ